MRFPLFIPIFFLIRDLKTCFRNSSREILSITWGKGFRKQTSRKAERGMLSPVSPSGYATDTKCKGERKGEKKRHPRARAFPSFSRSCPDIAATKLARTMLPSQLSTSTLCSDVDCSVVSSLYSAAHARSSSSSSNFHSPTTLPAEWVRM